MLRAGRPDPGRPRRGARTRVIPRRLTGTRPVTIFKRNENRRGTDAEDEMWRAVRPFALLLIPFIALAGPAEPATYHVAPGGSDSAPGTLAAPFSTLQHAADLVLPGDTVLVRAGTYHQVVTVSRSGTRGRRSSSPRTRESAPSSTAPGSWPASGWAASSTSSTPRTSACAA